MPRVPVGPEESEFIRRRIERFAEEAPAELHWQLEHVKVNQALPLYIGWTETAGIRPDGTLIRWVTEDVTNSQELADDTWVNLALVQGATRYPALRSLIPIRPQAAKTCEGCKGGGRIPGMAANVICACGGIGWMPPGSGS